jgi:hypothetical protein
LAVNDSAASCGTGASCHSPTGDSFTGSSSGRPSPAPPSEADTGPGPGLGLGASLVLLGREVLPLRRPDQHNPAASRETISVQGVSTSSLDLPASRGPRNRCRPRPRWTGATPQRDETEAARRFGCISASSQSSRSPRRFAASLIVCISLGPRARRRLTRLALPASCLRPRACVGNVAAPRSNNQAADVTVIACLTRSRGSRRAAREARSRWGAPGLTWPSTAVTIEPPCCYVCPREEVTGARCQARHRNVIDVL